MNLRKYGVKPYRVAVVHGGPGAAGSLRPVAEELSKFYGVLEPLQTKATVDDQIEELRDIVIENMEKPITLIGHSWGAMLIYMFASKYPDLVDKIILVSSGSFEEKYYEGLNSNRDEKLTPEERDELELLRNALGNPESENINAVFARFGQLMDKLDTFSHMKIEEDTSLFSYEIFSKVWPEAHVLRKSGRMYEMGKMIKCPVVAIHGSYDSHPIEGIRDSLGKIITNFKFYELNKCGHSPWMERYAAEEFYNILKREI
jgi:pimeloyl-ACP methyl ester carboxylesterase